MLSGKIVSQGLKPLQGGAGHPLLCQRRYGQARGRALSRRRLPLVTLRRLHDRQMASSLSSEIIIDLVRIAYKINGLAAVP